MDQCVEISGDDVERACLTVAALRCAFPTVHARNVNTSCDNSSASPSLASTWSGASLRDVIESRMTNRTPVTPRDTPRYQVWLEGADGVAVVVPWVALSGAGPPALIALQKDGVAVDGGPLAFPFRAVVPAADAGSRTCKYLSAITLERVSDDAD
jgi:hypothetical protein